VPNTFTTRRQVEFRDTDAAGIVHFSVFFTMMESAEHALLRSLGLSVHRHDQEGILSWPRVAAKCDYRSPARFEEMLDLEVAVARLGNKSVTYQTTFRCGTREVAQGEITAVCCRIEAGQPPRAVPIPAEIADQLRTYLGPFDL
jgi:4-hydroxybenzoyl-CoA thioesterase/acyl-CoA thioester hydrolase